MTWRCPRTLRPQVLTDFELEPDFARAGSIRVLTLLGNDAFEPELAGMPEDRRGRAGAFLW